MTVTDALFHGFRTRPLANPDERPFWNAIDDDPENLVKYGVFADYLESIGSDRAPYIRGIYNKEIKIPKTCDPFDPNTRAILRAIDKPSEVDYSFPIRVKEYYWRWVAVVVGQDYTHPIMPDLDVTSFNSNRGPMRRAVREILRLRIDLCLEDIRVSELIQDTMAVQSSPKVFLDLMATEPRLQNYPVTNVVIPERNRAVLETLLFSKNIRIAGHSHIERVFDW